MVSRGGVRARSTASFARWGESVAAEYLQRGGMRILARNWRCRGGEIDIVARWGKTLVIAEVKTRASLRFGTPLQAVTPAKLRRLRWLGRRWATAHCRVRARVRVDVVSVLAGGEGRTFVLHHRGVA